MPDTPDDPLADLTPDQRRRLVLAEKAAHILRSRGPLSADSVDPHETIWLADYLEKGVAVEDDDEPFPPPPDPSHAEQFRARQAALVEMIAKRRERFAPGWEAALRAASSIQDADDTTVVWGTPDGDRPNDQEGADPWRPGVTPPREESPVTDGLIIVKARDLRAGDRTPDWTVTERMALSAEETTPLGVGPSMDPVRVMTGWDGGREEVRTFEPDEDVALLERGPVPAEAAEPNPNIDPLPRDV